MSEKSSRKEFLQTSMLIAGGVLFNRGFDFFKYKPRLAFSTLACPDWSFEQITDYAIAHGYSGIEMRGLQREIDLTKSPAFTTGIQATLALMKDKKLHFVDLGSSSTLHFSEGEERQKNLASGKAFIDLAQALHCPYVRVYPNLLPKERSNEETMGLIEKGLFELGEYGKLRRVMVLMETHGDLVRTADLQQLMTSVSHPNVGLVWDPTNMWTITREPMGQMYDALRKYIHHVHIKDAKMDTGKPVYTRLGQGDVPIFEAIDLLAQGGYRGYLSYEWEKLWHPELEEPETALADYPVVMKKHF